MIELCNNLREGCSLGLSGTGGFCGFEEILQAAFFFLINKKEETIEADEKTTVYSC